MSTKMDITSDSKEDETRQKFERIEKGREMNPVATIEIGALLGVRLGDPCPEDGCDGKYSSVDITWNEIIWQVAAVCGKCDGVWVIDEDTEMEPVSCCFADDVSGTESESENKNLKEEPIQSLTRTDMQHRSNFMLSMRKMMSAMGVLLRADNYSRSQLGEIAPAGMIAPMVFEEDIALIFSGCKLASFKAIGDHLDKCLEVIGIDEETNLIDMNSLKVAMATCTWLTEATARTMLRSWVNRFAFRAGKGIQRGSDLSVLHPYAAIEDIKQLSVLSLMMIKVLNESGVTTGVISDVSLVVRKAIEGISWEQ